MVRQGKNCTLTSNAIPFPDGSNSTIFTLHIDPISHYNGLGATVYLQNPVVEKHKRVLIAKFVVSIPQPRETQERKRVSYDNFLPPTLFDSSVIMDFPPEKTRHRNACVVASFPVALSHKTLRLVSAPFLDMKLTIRQHT